MNACPDTNRVSRSFELWTGAVLRRCWKPRPFKTYIVQGISAYGTTEVVPFPSARTEVFLPLQARSGSCLPESSPESSAGSAIFLSSGYFSISVGGADTRLPVIIAFNSSALTPALLSK
jgi:hypothetical protein